MHVAPRRPTRTWRAVVRNRPPHPAPARRVRVRAAAARCSPPTTFACVLAIGADACVLAPLDPRGTATPAHARTATDAVAGLPVNWVAGYGWKLKQVRAQLLKHRASHDIVLFTDSFDSYIFSPLDEIVDKFKARTPSHSPHVHACMAPISNVAPDCTAAGTQPRAASRVHAWRQF